MEWFVVATEFLNQVVAFVTSDEVQAFVTAAIGVITAYALTQNKLSSLKVANAQVQMSSQNNTIESLKNELFVANQKVESLTSKVDALLDINATAFLSSRLDPKARSAIKDTYLKISEKQPKVSETIEKTVNLIEEIIEKVDIPAVQTLAQKMKAGI